MKTILLMLLLLNPLFALEYFAKIEPIKSYKIGSDIQGKVSYASDDKEFSFIKNSTLLLQIESQQEDIELNALEQSLTIQSEIFQIKEQNYQSKAKVKQLSTYEKNSEKLEYLQAKQTIVDIQKSIATLKNQKIKKEFSLKKKYLTKLYFKKGEIVNIGDLLYESHDLSQLKITLFVKADLLPTIKQKSIYIDGKKSDFTLLKVSKLKDKHRVSTHEVILSSKNNKKDFVFGKIVKVEFR